MAERLKFRKLISTRLTETEEYKDELSEAKEQFNKEKREIEIIIYDILIEPSLLNVEPKSLNTELKLVLPSQKLKEKLKEKVEEIVRGADIKLFYNKINYLPIDLNTSIIETQSKRNLNTQISNLKLITPNLPQQTSSPATELMLPQKTSTENELSQLPILDLKLTKHEIEELKPELNTSLASIRSTNVIESLADSETSFSNLIFEEFIESDGVFPRGFSESQNSPIVVLIGEEDEPEWHSPIIYSLKELFLEINEKHPRITFRRPEIYEEGIEEIIDSTEPHSLEQFGFESKIEFLDARKFHYSFEDFVKIVEGRLKSGFLQQFGILVIAVRRSNIEKAKEALEKFKGLKVYTCFSEETKKEIRFLKYLPKDLDEKERYKLFCSKVLGVEGHGDFFRKLEVYRNRLESTYKRFSVFVKRDIKGDEKGKDPHQYPLKVAIFVYLLNDLKNRKKEVINNLEKLYDFIKQALKNKNISIEEEVKVSSQNSDIIPDLIYRPDNNEIYIEIETLIGTIEPLKKIDETVEKYEDKTSANIWIVLKPISALLHYEGLKHRERVYKKLYEDKKIEFKVLTLSSKNKWELINIDDFVKSYGK